MAAPTEKYSVAIPIDSGLSNSGVRDAMAAVIDELKAKMLRGTAEGAAPAPRPWNALNECIGCDSPLGQIDVGMFCSGCNVQRRLQQARAWADVEDPALD
jgi:hypothetical protein